MHNDWQVECVMFSGLLRLQPPAVPNTNVFSEVVVDAFALAVVGYAISISLGKTFALKHGYKVDSNQVRQVYHYNLYFHSIYSVLTKASVVTPQKL